MSGSIKKPRLPRGEAKLIVQKWCDDYVRVNGDKPTYTLALQGSGVAAMTFSTPWDEWKANYNATLPTAQLSLMAQAAPIALPAVITEAWSSAIRTLEAAMLQELAADKKVVRRERDEVIDEKVAMAAEITAILADGESALEEFEVERANAAAALTSAIATIADRDASLIAMEAELVRAQKTIAVQESELKMVKATAVKLENSLDQAVVDERAAHVSCEKTLTELTELQIAKTRLAEEVAAANAARCTAEAALAAKEKKMESLEAKLESTRQDLTERTAGLAEAAVTVAELRGHLAAAETRTEQARVRGEAEAAQVRERVVELERELAGLKPDVTK